DECRERGRLVDREIGEDPAIHLDPGKTETLDEPVVRDAVLARRGVDPLDPQAAEVALAGAAVAVCVDERVGDLLLRLAVQARTLPAVAGRALEDDPALLVGVDGPLHSCHSCSL